MIAPKNNVLPRSRKRHISIEPISAHLIKPIHPKGSPVNAGSPLLFAQQIAANHLVMPSQNLPCGKALVHLNGHWNEPFNILHLPLMRAPGTRK
jgi:hypothetical protein